MTGTSLDAVDAVLLRIGGQGLSLQAKLAFPMPAGLQSELAAVIADGGHTTLDQIGSQHRRLGQLYAEAVLALLDSAGVKACEVRAIGSHGQTVWHRPDGELPFTLQLGDGATLAALTGITTVCDFRSADMAAGGQGAPLAPAFHAMAFADPGHCRVIANLGGIANITVLDPGKPVIGFDTGPANTLLDGWSLAHLGTPFDRDGAWAASGTVSQPLLSALLQDAYFARPAPKSTGREYFNLAWLRQHPQLHGVEPADVQATLAELTARTLADSVRAHTAATEVAVCGGGALNVDLCSRIRRALPGSRIISTKTLGIEPEWVEAAAFAWLAHARLTGLPGNIPSVTGASRPALLGCVYAGIEA